MDPRHPEQAISRMRELMKQYDRVEADIRTASVATKLGALEREGALVIQELCLVAPRLHEAMMQTSRQRRHDLTKWNGNVTRESFKSPLDNVAEVIARELRGEESKLSVQVEHIELKPKKKTTKKKTTKKAKK